MNEPKLGTEAMMDLTIFLAHDTVSCGCETFLHMVTQGWRLYSPVGLLLIVSRSFCMKGILAQDPQNALTISLSLKGLAQH
jgi:hypothetical protein